MVVKVGGKLWIIYRNNIQFGRERFFYYYYFTENDVEQEYFASHIGIFEEKE